MAWTLTVVREGIEQHLGTWSSVSLMWPCLPLQNQGGKTNEQERKPYGCSSDCRKDSYP